MNTNKNKTISSLFRRVLPFVVSLSLLLSLPSCTSSSGSEDSTDASTTAPSPTENRPTAESGDNTTTESPADASTGDDLLLYYVSLVEELQKEIQALKAENFILSSQGKNETDLEVSDSPSADYTYEEEGGTITILSYKGSDRHPTVPDEIGGKPVTKIGENAFSGTDVISVILPESVTEIDWFAFANCSDLTSVTAGSSVKKVGYGAFDGCPSALTLICPDDSYLSAYGKSFGIAVTNG